MTENSDTIERNRDVWRSLIAEWKEMSLDFKMLVLSCWWDILGERSWNCRVERERAVGIISKKEIETFKLSPYLVTRKRKDPKIIIKLSRKFFWGFKKKNNVCSHIWLHNSFRLQCLCNYLSEVSYVTGNFIKVIVIYRNLPDKKGLIVVISLYIIYKSGRRAELPFL